METRYGRCRTEEGTKTRLRLEPPVAVGRWTSASAALIGRDHVLVGRNGQDHAASAAEGDWGVGVVADGCGAARGSEVGARITAAVATRAASEALRAGRPVEVLPEVVGREVRRVLRSVATSVAARDAASFAAEHLQATLLLVAVRGDDALAFAWGDGHVRIDARIVTLDEGGRPRYLAAGLASNAPPDCTFVERVDHADRLAVATDGFDEATLARLPDGPSSALLRWMRVRARSGAFADDGAVALLTRAPEGGS